LPRAVHQYKFIVDNVWRFSKHNPTFNDCRGNINNILDTSNINIDEYIYKKNEKEKETNKSNSKINNKSNGKRIRKSESSYNNTFPFKEDLNLDAVVVPENYKEIYNINTYHKQLVPVPPHINL